MDPNQNTGPDESVMPNVPPQPQAEVDTGGMPSTSVPSAPPPAAAWLPPNVAHQPATGGASSGNGTAAQPIDVNVPAPAVADDGDVIEKEWVEKAKQIVARTRQDPYNQTRELHKFKAEYMQKRYNKTIEAAPE
jgi:hypothetical protein